MCSMCSIGCGEGHLEEGIPSTLTDIQIKYAGIDTNETFCNLAQEMLKLGKKCNAKIHNQDFINLTNEPFDVVITQPYFSSPGLTVVKALGLTKRNG